MDYEELSRILEKLDLIDLKTIKEVAKEYKAHKPVADGHFIQINHLALVLRVNRTNGVLKRSRKYEIDILRKDNEVTGPSLLYSSAISSPVVLNNLSLEIEEVVKKTLQEITDKSTLIIQKYPPKTEKIPIDEQTLNKLRVYLIKKMTIEKFNQRPEIIRFIFSSLREEYKDEHLPSDVPLIFFYRLIKAKMLTEYQSNGHIRYRSSK
jgi:hypothetical protein